VSIIVNLYTKKERHKDAQMVFLSALAVTTKAEAVAAAAEKKD